MPRVEHEKAHTPMSEGKIASIGVDRPEPAASASKYDRLIAEAKRSAAAKAIVVHPCDETSLRGAVEAAAMGLISATLVGPAAKINNVAREHNLDIGKCELVDVAHSDAAASKAVELIRAGQGELLMKGSLHTDELMRPVTASATKELHKLQVELCYLQDWIKAAGARVIVVFEGRDAAGKGGTIKAITERVSPRVFRVAALPAPSDREKTQMFLQRYIERFPAGGEIVIFDRSWYNRAGVEKVMSFVSEKEAERFLSICPEIEKYITDAGIILIKFWLEVGQNEQERRFHGPRALASCKIG